MIFAILSKTRILKVAVVVFILGLAFYPWPFTESYGEISGFDPANVYVQSNPNFEVRLDPNQINVKNIAAGTEAIHLALSDLPYKISFNVTVQNQSSFYDPLRIIISYPLNPNQIHLIFSSSNRSVIMELRDQEHGSLRHEKLFEYSVGQPLRFSFEISTIQSSSEFISVTATNRTYSKTVTLQSEVQSLIRDQSRLISIEVYGANSFSPGFFTFGGKDFWTVLNYVEGGNSSLVQSNGGYSVVEGVYLSRYLSHDFHVSPLDLSSFDALEFTFNGSGTGKILRLWLNTDWSNRFFLDIPDVLVGPERVFVPLSSLSKVGNPTLDSIDKVGIDFPDSTGTWNFSDIVVGKTERLEGAVAVNIFDLSINIMPHSLAYAPLTTSPFPVLFSLVAISCSMLFFSKDLWSAMKRLYVKVKSVRFSRVSIFAITFAGVFCLYFVLFGLGDHAFDMFAQKLWSYDIAKHGLLSLYQRPAVTSAAAMYNGEGTMHAIFAYSPLAGLYYSIIGKTYFLLSPSPNVYDPFFTVNMKSFQTLTVLACGFIVFKLLRRYGSSWRGSFLVMLTFLLNPLIIYDAAVWGHQDALLMFFLLLSLWAYESNHPKTSYVSLALAIMVKSTAFAPAAFMIFLILRKFGLRSLLDGALVGLTSAFATIIPFVAQGASPSMLVNSTVFRVLQFGTTAFQYPRSAAVSPDGYNIWPLITQSIGLQSRERMWYSDYNSLPYLGISYLLAGQILFVSIALILAYFATKKNARLPGGAALLLAVLMIASTTFLTKTTARYVFFGVAYLLVSYHVVGRRTKWLVIGLLTFTSVFAMHGLLVAYTGDWMKIYPAMSPDIPINGFILPLYLSDSVITAMILVNLFAFLLILAQTIRAMRKDNSTMLSQPRQ